METELTFVAPEGVYSVVEEHKPAPLNPHIIIATPALFPTRLTTIVVRFHPSKPGASPGFAQLLGGGKDSKSKEKEKERDKEKEREKEREKEKEREDGRSVSSSEHPGSDDDAPNGSPELTATSPSHTATSPTLDTPKLFAPAAVSMGKKKSVSRPKHNIRTTTSTFVTRLQSVEGLNKLLQAKHGDISFLFYNSAKNFFWTELGTKPKVSPSLTRSYHASRVSLDGLTAWPSSQS